MTLSKLLLTANPKLKININPRFKELACLLQASLYEKDQLGANPSIQNNYEQKEQIFFIQLTLNNI